MAAEILSRMRHLISNKRLAVASVVCMNPCKKSAPPPPRPTINSLPGYPTGLIGLYLYSRYHSAM